MLSRRLATFTCKKYGEICHNKKSCKGKREIEREKSSKKMRREKRKKNIINERLKKKNRGVHCKENEKNIQYF